MRMTLRLPHVTSRLAGQTKAKKKRPAHWAWYALRLSPLRPKARRSQGRVLYSLVAPASRSVAENTPYSSPMSASVGILEIFRHGGEGGCTATHTFRLCPKWG